MVLKILQLTERLLFKRFSLLLTFLSATNLKGKICVTPLPAPKLPGDVSELFDGDFSDFVLQQN